MPFSPEEIEKKDFLLTLRGYDKEEVRAFLEAVASDYRTMAQSSREGVPEEAYEEIGREIGSVMQAAKESATQMKRQAELDATELRMRVDKEATRIRDAATNAAKRLHDEADQYAAEIRVKADQYKTEVTARADKEAADKIKESRNRLERLQTTESKVRQRLYSLEAMIQNLRQEIDVNDAAGTDIIELNKSDEEEHEGPKHSVRASVTPAGVGADGNNRPKPGTQVTT